MMGRRLNRFDRRRLLQYGAAGAGALGVAPLLRPGPRRAAAQGRGPLTGALESDVAALASSALPFGAPTDLAAGWDGTLWAIDDTGAPSAYDQVAQAWVLQGTGIDAVAYASAPGVGSPAAGTPTPTAVPEATVAPPRTPVPTAAPLTPGETGTPIAPATVAPRDTPAPTAAPLGPATSPVGQATLSRVAAAAPEEPNEGQVQRIASTGARAAQGAPSATPAPTAAPLHTPAPTVAPLHTPGETGTPIAPATVVPPLAPVAQATPAGTATPAATGTPAAGGTATAATATATASHTPTGAAQTATRTPATRGAVPAGYYLFRGRQVLYLPLTSPAGVDAPVAPTPAALETPATTPGGQGAAFVPVVSPGAPDRQGGPTPAPSEAPPPLATAAPATGPAAVVTPPGPAATPARVAPASVVPFGAAAPLTPGVPQPIAAVWPRLPDSFKLGVRGAAEVNGVLYLFKGGRCVRADGAAPPITLTAAAFWPRTPTWTDGVIDLVGSAPDSNQVFLVRGAEYLVFDPASPGGQVLGAPRSLNVAFGGALLAALRGQGGAADAVLFGENLTLGTALVFQGPAVSSFEFAVTISSRQWRRYVAAHFAPSWPATWNPVLQQAPSGRAGALWATTVRDGAVLYHDGTGWSPAGGNAHSVAAGADGSAYSISVAQHNLYRWNAERGKWDTVVEDESFLAQVAVGSAGQVWVRAQHDAVRRLQGGQFTSVPNLPTAAHIAAGADGTVWSCDGSGAAVFRLLSESPAPPEAIPVPGPVQKVTGTGYGTAHCLVGQGTGASLYRYASPYTFATAQTYTPAGLDPIETGLGNLYVTIGSGGSTSEGRYFVQHVVALDARTGQEVSRSAAAPSGMRYTAPVFDPLQEAVYVGVTSIYSPHSPFGRNADSQIRALDARDLTSVRWTLSLTSSIDSGLTLAGTDICFADLTGHVSAFDTRVAPGATPPLRWTNHVELGQNEYAFTQRPVIAGGVVYASLWYQVDRQVGGRLEEYWQLSLTTCSVADGSGFEQRDVQGATLAVGAPPPVFPPPPVLGQAIPPGGSQPAPALFVSGGTHVFAVFVAGAGAPVTAKVYTLPGTTATITSGFAFGGGGLWFGDSQATLYGLDEQMQPLAHTPKALAEGRVAQAIRATPVPYQSEASGQATSGQTVVFLGVFDPDLPPSLLTFDPSTGNVGATPTGRTALKTLSPAVADGVLYVAGATAVGTSGDEPSQVFGIRVDEAVQGLRAFVAESELLQDFDPAPAGQAEPANPQGSARYQTHLTVLDDVHAPRAGTPLKVWADAPTTIQVNGTVFAVGPEDGQYAAAQTGVDGVVTIVSGDVAGTGQDRADIAAAALRVWAPFMNPFERLVLFPDRSFHNRLATTHATPPASPGNDDPTRLNLQTVRSYGPLQRGGAPTGAPLFTDADVQQNQPQQAAQAIQTMTRATGTAPPGGAASGATSGPAGRVRAGAGAAWVRRQTDTPGAAGRYLAYDDLPGTRYNPVNTASSQPAAVVQPAGLSFSREAAGATQPTPGPLTPTTPPAFRPLTPAAAAAAIDALDGTPWEQSEHAPPHVRAAARAGAVQGGGSRVGSWWTDFWNWLKGIVAEITHFIVSVAEDIYVGIRLIVNGVVHVFKQIVRAVEEVAHAIGVLFKELAKAIEKVIEALSVLFHFGEILKTQQLLLQELRDRISGVTGNAAYPGVKSVVNNQVIPALKTFFEKGETAINNDFDGLANRIAGGTAAVGGPGIDQLQGHGATAHTMYTVTPKAGGQAASLAVPCSWGTQKAKTGVPAASVGGAAQQATAASPAQVLAAFLDEFVVSIDDNGPLQSQWQQVRDGASRLGHPTSAADFFRQAVAELLRTVALLLDGVLAVAEAFLDGLFKQIDALMSLVFDSQQGLIAAPLHIPVLSWLFTKLTGEPLTVLNAVLLVAAIPVTLVWRVFAGQWPSQSVGTATGQLLGTGTPPPVKDTIVAILGGTLEVASGIFQGIGDAWGVWEKPRPAAPPILSYLSLACAVGTVVVDIPAITGATGSTNWVPWGMVLGLGMLNVFGIIPLEKDGPAQKVLGYLVPFLLLVLSAGQLAAYVVAWEENNQQGTPSDSYLFGLNIASTIPGMINWLKLLPPAELWPILVAGVDVIMGIVVGSLSVYLAVEAAE